jgi:serine protease inhibitor
MRKIPTILEPPLDPRLRLILLDAIYFKGEWLAPFETNLTRDLPFTLGNGQAVQQPRMSRTGRYAYSEEDGFQAVELPYAGGQMSMFVFLPKGGLDEFLKKFTVKDFEASVQRMQFTQRHRRVASISNWKTTTTLTGVLPADGHAPGFHKPARTSAACRTNLCASALSNKKRTSP